MGYVELHKVMSGLFMLSLCLNSIFLLVSLPMHIDVKITVLPLGFFRKKVSLPLLICNFSAYAKIRKNLYGNPNPLTSHEHLLLYMLNRK